MLIPIHFEGSSLDDLKALPKEARQVIGFQLERVQSGIEPSNWKPVNGLGKGITGVREIRVEIDTNIYRSAYVTKFGDFIAVLHCWKKKTMKLSDSDKKLIVDRYKSAKGVLS
jgi:phage-related protein